MKIKTARFWVWHNEGFVRLAMQDGDKIEFLHGGPHEEGYTYTVECYRRDGDIIEYQRSTWGRDCDGGFGNNDDCHCHIRDLGARTERGFEPDAPPLPAWVRGESSQYDEYAEAAGY